MHIVRVATAEELNGIARQSMADAVVVIGVARFDQFEHDLLRSGVGVACGRRGVALIALVGHDAERAHDALDALLAAESLDDVTTTWHTGSDIDDVAATVWAMATAQERQRVIVLMDASRDEARAVQDSLERARTIAEARSMKQAFIEALTAFASVLEPFATEPGGLEWDGQEYRKPAVDRYDNGASKWHAVCRALVNLLQTQEGELSSGQYAYLDRTLFGGMGSFSDVSLDSRKLGHEGAQANVELNSVRTLHFHRTRR